MTYTMIHTASGYAVVSSDSHAYAEFVDADDARDALEALTHGAAPDDYEWQAASDDD